MVTGHTDNGALVVGAPSQAEEPIALAPGHWVDLDASDRAPARPRFWLRNVTAVAEVLFTTTQGPPPAARMRWLCAELDDFLAHAGARSRFVFHLSLWVVAWLSPWWVLRPLPLRWLSAATRSRALERFERSFAGPTLLAVKAMLCILYYEHPDTAREMRIDGRCLVMPQGGEKSTTP